MQLQSAYADFCIEEGLPDYWPAYTIYTFAQNLTKPQRDALLIFAEAFEALLEGDVK